MKITIVVILMITVMMVCNIYAGKELIDRTSIENLVPKNNAMVVEELKAKLSKLSSDGSLSTVLAGEQINWQVISSGGIEGTSTSYKLVGTIGQTAVGAGTSSGYVLNHGYWQNFSTNSGCCVLAGDANNDSILGISDLTFFVDYMFNSGTAPVCYESFDNNIDCILGISDLTYFVDYMFNAGPPPPPCHSC